MERKEFESKQGFDLRLEARLKNASLVRAREQTGLSGREIANEMGLTQSSYCSYETMRRYPSSNRQRRICDFFRSRGIFVLEEDLFPEKLKNFKPSKKYVTERTIPLPMLLSLSEVSQRMLPVIESQVGVRIEAEDRKQEVNRYIQMLSPHEREIIEMRYKGEKTYEEIGKKFGISRSRVMQIEEKAKKIILERIFRTHRQILPADVRGVAEKFFCWKMSIREIIREKGIYPPFTGFYEYENPKQREEWDKAIKETTRKLNQATSTLIEQLF